MLIDGQALLSEIISYPQALRDLYKFENEGLEDFVMRQPKPWLISFVGSELFVQLPFFFVATYALVYRRNWIRIPMIIYGSHVATTVIAILAEFIAAPLAEGYFSSEEKRWTLIGVYLPYLVIPVLLVISFGMTPQPFDARKAKTN